MKTMSEKFKQLVGIKKENNDTPDRVLNNIRSNTEFAKITSKFSVDNPGISLEKYLDFETYIPDYFRDISFLGINNGKKRSMLDIGTGVGYFPYMSTQFGNESIAMDVDDYELYNRTISALNVRRVVHRIEAFEPLPAMPLKFDLITAFAICFNHHKSPGLWGAAEWTYFLHDLVSNHMNQGGRIFLRLNAEDDGAFGKEEVPALFAKLGAEITNTDVDFKDISSLRNAL